jgi:hypothetical protein
MITIDEITIVIDGREIIYDYSEQTVAVNQPCWPQ